MDKEKLIEVLNKFFGMDGVNGTYAHWLTRTKSAYSVGTITIDDFEEFTDETIDELADAIIEKFQ